MANAKRIGGLGKGLNALIPQSPAIDNETAGEGGARMIPLEGISVNPYQPRRVFDEEKLKELAASIAEHGVVQPIFVRVAEEGYQVIAGERRVRAARQAGLTEIPALVRDITENEMMEISLIENIQRADLDPVEEARAYKRLSEEFRQTQEQIAGRVSKSRSYIANSMRLLHLPDPILDHLAAGVLHIGHVRPLLTLSEQDAISLADRLIRESGTAREAELWAKQIAEPDRFVPGAGDIEPGSDGFAVGQGGFVAESDGFTAGQSDFVAGANGFTAGQSGVVAGLDGLVTGQGSIESAQGGIDPAQELPHGNHIPAETAKKKAETPLPVELSEIQRILREAVNTKVEITSGVKGGKIIIDYYTQDDLERILELITGNREIQ
ncbi:MAG: ParB/RepB/Spo0J family partition protein [Peptococcaceae bacterium]|nr:ParB/RepB/Spo0J family partition protein [Peptococcaceae bacterium]